MSSEKFDFFDRSELQLFSLISLTLKGSTYCTQLSDSGLLGFLFISVFRKLERDAYWCTAEVCLFVDLIGEI